MARAAALVLAFAMVLAVVRSGPYFFCAPMGVGGAVASHACCAAAKCPMTSPTIERGACCQAIPQSDLLMVHTSPAPDVAASPWLGVLPETHRTHLMPDDGAGAPISMARARLARARPPTRPPSPSFLQVYLI